MAKRVPTIVRATKRFVRDYERASTTMRDAARGALWDVLRQIESDPANWQRRHDTVSGSGSGDVIEVDITSGDRLLVHSQAGSLFLMAIGSHDIVRHYARTGDVLTELALQAEVPAFLKSLERIPFFPANGQERWQQYKAETDPAWMKFLDDHQHHIASQVLAGVSLKRSASAWYFAAVCGGPGTGKTAVLLNVFERLWETGVQAQVHMASNVIRQIERATALGLNGYRLREGQLEEESAGGVLLVDDPNDVSLVEKALWLAQQRVYQGVVVFVDPLQMRRQPEDRVFDSLFTGTGAHRFDLKVCYRQKRLVGEAAKRAFDIIAASTPYAAESKQRAFREERSRMTALANDIEFANPGGRFVKYPDATIKDLECEVQVASRSPGLWRHDTPFLVAYDDERWERLPKPFLSALRTLTPKYELVELSSVEKIKGLDFQHAIVILSAEVFEQLEQGFEGSGNKVYRARRLLRIPLSRAKDSVAVLSFV